MGKRARFSMFMVDPGLASELASFVRETGLPKSAVIRDAVSWFMERGLPGGPLPAGPGETDGKPVAVPFTVEPELYESLKLFAKSHGLTMSAVLRGALRAYLSRVSRPAGGAEGPKFAVVGVDVSRIGGGPRSIVARYKLPTEPPNLYLADRLRKGALKNIIFRVAKGSGLYLLSYSMGNADAAARLRFRRWLESQGCVKLANRAYLCRSRPGDPPQDARPAKLVVLEVTPLRPRDQELVDAVLRAAPAPGGEPN